MSLLIINATLSGSQPRHIAHKAQTKDFKIHVFCQSEGNESTPLLSMLIKNICAVSLNESIILAFQNAGDLTQLIP